MEMKELRQVKAEVGGRILYGELLRLNNKTATIRFPGSGGKPAFTIKRHIVKHQVKFLGSLEDVPRL